jgi:HD-GYP domain-containing protein (c-di-GMP phosphodiesterase class II)
MRKRKEKKLRIKKGKKTPNKLVAVIKEWMDLPRIIGKKRKNATGEISILQEELTFYRCYETTRDYITTQIDKNIRNSYYALINEMNDLVSYEAEYYLRFCSLKTLRFQNGRWDQVKNHQDVLLAEIKAAHSALEFYNKMAASKDMQSLKKKKEMDVGHRLSKVHQAFENALAYYDKYDQEHSISAFGASVLNAEKARKLWVDSITEIKKMEKTNVDPYLVVDKAEGLVKSIYDAPGLANWVNEIEKRFVRLSYDHELLVNSYGKAVIQQEIMDNYTELLKNVIPDLWLHGQKDQLSQFLKELENFLVLYEPQVAQEIAFAERHHGRRESPAPGQDRQPSHLMELTKIFISAMDNRDPLMGSHSLNIARLAVATGKLMNWKAEEIQLLEIAAVLHDVGNIRIPESILIKKGKLSDEETEKIRMHPVYGAQILQSSDLFKGIIPWVYHHQELWNGSGYPQGLKADEIPIQARIISICEYFDDLLSGNTTKNKLNVEQALDRIQSESGSLFDPAITAAFVKAVETQEKGFLKKYVEK